MTSLLYTAELDLAEEDIRPFLDWYAYRHVPDLFPLGFRSCACYRTLGGDMNLFDVYEIPGHEVFSHPGYRRMNERDRHAPPILAKRRKKAHTIYRQVALDGIEPEAAPSLDADWIVVVRFDLTAEPSSVAKALSSNLAPWRDCGVVRSRLGVRTQDHPNYTTHRPSFMLVLESDRDQSGTGLVTMAVEAIAPSASSPDGFAARRVVPWPTN